MVQEDQAGVLGLPYKAYIQLLRAFKLLPKVRNPSTAIPVMTHPSTTILGMSHVLYM